MATLVNSLFTKYNLTEEEEANGKKLTTDNINYLQNLLCQYAEEKVSLPYDPNNPLRFAQTEAELAGQIGLLSMLINQAKEAYLEI